MRGTLPEVDGGRKGSLVLHRQFPEPRFLDTIFGHMAGSGLLESFERGFCGHELEFNCGERLRIPAALLIQAGNLIKQMLKIINFSCPDDSSSPLKTTRSYTRSALLPKLAAHPFVQAQTRFASQHPGNSRSTLVEGPALPLRLSLCPCDIRQ